MSIEDRRNPRLFLAASAGAEWGQIEINGCALPCASVQDVSVSGAGVAIPLPLKPGSRVTMRLSAAQLEIAISGSVIWHRPYNARNNETLYRAGISFDPADEENCYLFYGLVRSHAPSIDSLAV